MIKTLYVGNLPWSTSEDDLVSVFTANAHVDVQSARIVMDRETGRSKGFGFLELPEEQMEQAIEAMNGFMFGGRPLTVNEARPREPRGDMRR